MGTNILNSSYKVLTPGLLHKNVITLCNSPEIFSDLVAFLGVFFRKFRKNRKLYCGRSTTSIVTDFFLGIKYSHEIILIMEYILYLMFIIYVLMFRDNAFICSKNIWSIYSTTCGRLGHTYLEANITLNPVSG